MNGFCRDCQSPCKTCDKGVKKCTSCRKKLLLYKGTCVSSCPDKYEANNQTIN
jgi:hypothetical protein